MLQWPGSSEYLAAERKVWRVTPDAKDVAGFVRQVVRHKPVKGGSTMPPTFTQVVIRKAGHIAPYDAPYATRDMIDRLIEGRGYVNEPDPAVAA